MLTSLNIMNERIWPYMQFDPISKLILHLISIRMTSVRISIFKNWDIVTMKLNSYPIYAYIVGTIIISHHWLEPSILGLAFFWQIRYLWKTLNSCNIGINESKDYGEKFTDFVAISLFFLNDNSTCGIVLS